MIKSKHNTFGSWLLFSITMIFFLVFLFAAFTRSLPVTISYYLAFAFPVVMFLFLISAYIKNITIDTTEQTISFQNVITRRKITYLFSDFDGLVDTFLSHKGGQYKTIGLVKNKKAIRYIDSCYYSNYLELREGLTKMNYFGTLDIGHWKQMKFLLRLPIID